LGAREALLLLLLMLMLMLPLSRAVLLPPDMCYAARRRQRSGVQRLRPQGAL